MSPFEILKNLFNATQVDYTIISENEIIIPCESLFVASSGRDILPQADILKGAYETIDIEAKIHLNWDGKNFNWLVVSEK